MCMPVFIHEHTLPRPTKMSRGGSEMMVKLIAMSHDHLVRKPHVDILNQGKDASNALLGLRRSRAPDISSLTL